MRPKISRQAIWYRILSLLYPHGSETHERLDLANSMSGQQLEASRDAHGTPTQMSARTG